jgi:hypothetical protein
MFSATAAGAARDAPFGAGALLHGRDQPLNFGRVRSQLVGELIQVGFGKNDE